MARQITLDSREKIEIVNSDGDVTGFFWWNPTDFDIAKRCEKVLEFFDNFKMPDGEEENKLFEMTDQVKQQFNFLLDSKDAADELFQCNPFTLREDGTLFCEYVLEVLVQYIESEMNRRIERSSNKVKKYTDKYTK